MEEAESITVAEAAAADKEARIETWIRRDHQRQRQLQRSGD